MLHFWCCPCVRNFFFESSIIDQIVSAKEVYIGIIVLELWVPYHWTMTHQQTWTAVLGNLGGRTIHFSACAGLAMQHATMVLHSEGVWEVEERLPGIGWRFAKHYAVVREVTNRDSRLMMSWVSWCVSAGRGRIGCVCLISCVGTCYVTANVMQLKYGFCILIPVWLLCNFPFGENVDGE